MLPKQIREVRPRCERGLSAAAARGRPARQPRGSRAGGAMRTLIISDLHLGSDLARRSAAPPRAARAAAASGRRRRSRWCCSATCSSCATARRVRRSAAARPFFEDLGRALAGARAGAHGRQPRPRADRAVAGSARRAARARRRSASSSCIEPAEASPTARAPRRVGRARRDAASPTRGCGCAPTSTRRTATTSTAI